MIIKSGRLGRFLPLSRRLPGMAAGLIVGLLFAARVGAQPPPPPEGTPAPEAPPVAAPPPPYDPMPAAPTLAGQTASNEAAASDHHSVVGRTGIEARRIGDFARTQGQEAGCVAPCATTINALSVRRWTEHDYAYSFGLALGVGGGSSRPSVNEDAKTWDTYFGVGPTLGASFLLTSWKHLAVSWGPQFDFLFFLPSGKGSKSFLFNLRGVIEGELHLGMIGVPAASVALQTGIEASYLLATKDTKTPVANATASRWTVGMAGSQSLWDLVTKMSLRYYF